MRLERRLDADVDIDAELADIFGVKRADITAMQARLSGADYSLDAPLTDEDSGGSTRGEVFADLSPLPDDLVSEQIDTERRHAWLAGALTVLSERELRILRERRLQEEGETLEALGQKLGISKERVRQIENRALEKLRQALLERNPRLAVFRA